MAVLTREQYIATFGRDPDEHIRMNASVLGGGRRSASPAAPADEAEGPGLIKSTAMGAKAGLLFDWDDEIEAGVRSAFGPRKYAEVRDELRADKKRAQEAHPWGFGLGQVLGGVGSAVATGGVGGAALKLGTKGVAALAGAEGALGAAGASEADTAAGVAKDAAIGAGTGAVLGAGLHKAISKYAAGSIERRARHLTEDIGEGAVPTVKRRLGEVTKVGADEQSLAVSILDEDKAFSAALKKGQKEAAEVAKQRLSEHGATVAPLYKEIDKVTGGVPMGKLTASFDNAIAEADLPGNSRIRESLEEVRDDFTAWATKKVHKGDPETDLDNLKIPTQDVRDWVSRLKGHTTRAMGQLAETEAKLVRDAQHKAGHSFLRSHLESVAQETPDLAPVVGKILESNKKATVFHSVSDALEAAGTRKNWSPQNFRQMLAQGGLPLGAAVVGAGADLASGGLAYLGAKAGQATAKALDRAATQKLAALVRGVKAGNAGQKMALDAVTAGVPMATVAAVLNSWKAAPEWVREMIGETASLAKDAVTD